MRGISALAIALVAGAAVAPAAGAQTLSQGRVFQATPYVGYMVFGNYLEGPLNTTLSSSSAPVYGGQVALRVAPNVAVVGNVATSSGDLRVGIPFLGSQSIGTNSLLIYDAGVQLDLPSGGIARSVSPFVQAGIGQIRYDIKAASILSTQATNTAYNLGVGADLSLAKDFGLRVMAKDYFGRFDLKEATSIDYQAKTAHNFALSAGLRLDF